MDETTLHQKQVQSQGNHKSGLWGGRLAAFCALSFFVGVIIYVPREQGISGVMVGLNSGPWPAVDVLRKSPTDLVLFLKLFLPGFSGAGEDLLCVQAVKLPGQGGPDPEK